ncbi:MAG TPA: phage terminase large subunit [Rhodanobacteraceae bacterium]|nr:phage terminase large subunit [Rhodanobacteraceae bacterium]
MKLTEKQAAAQAVLAGDATHCMLFGGSRSGKTFLLVRNVVFRALKAPGSRHAIFRFRYNHLKASVVLDTFPKVMRVCFPGVKWTPHVQDGYVELQGGSQIWFAGLDDKDRTEKILGMEFVTLYFNECSQIPVGSIDTAVTRLAQKVESQTGGLLKLRAYYDCNPPTKAHWTYRRFVQKQDPETKQPIAAPEDYASFQINPADNVDNLSPEYLRMLESLPARMRKRFMDGQFGDANPTALFPEEHIDRWRVLDGKVPDMVRIVVAVDPSGSGDEDNADNDEIGIAVEGLGTDGNAYLLEDCTVKAGPGTWGRIAVQAYQRHAASCIVGETNYGGAMVQQTIQVAAQALNVRVPFKMVTASRGKVQRAEPFSGMYELGKVRHVGMFAKLEDELAGFSTFGFTGAGSPNRADAHIWALAELFPAMTATKAAGYDFSKSAAMGARI